MSIETIPATEARPKKAGSGYRRLQNRHRALIADHEQLRKAYQDLAGYSDALTAEIKRKTEECEQLQSMYAALQSDIALVLSENQRLLDAIAVMRSIVPPQPQPTYQPQPRPAVPPGLPSLFSRGLR